MSQPNTYINGNLSVLLVGNTYATTAWLLTDFEWSYKGDSKDVSMAPNNGAKTYQVTMTEVSFSGSAWYDPSTTPVATFNTGSTVAIIWKGNGTTANFTSSYCVIDDVKYTMTVDDKIKVTFSGHAGNDYVLA